MDRPWLAAAGGLIVVVVLVDVVWTAIAVSGGRGPLTDLLAKVLWRSASGRRSHRVLRLAGLSILIGLLLTWVVGLWVGWSLVFFGDARSVVDASTQVPADALATIAYAAGALAGAGAGFTAASGGWQLANNVAALCGLALVTLAISYLVQVVSATTHKRAIAVHIAGLGAGPAEIVARGAGQPSLGAVGSQVTSLTTQLAVIARQHLALPVLHYLHVADARASIELAIARLDEALTIIEAGLQADHRAITAPARLAVDEYLATLPTPTAGVAAPPPPSVGPLVDEGVDIDIARLHERVAALGDRRIALHALVQANGWDWCADVCGSHQPPPQP